MKKKVRGRSQLLYQIRSLLYHRSGYLYQGCWTSLYCVSVAVLVHVQEREITCKWENKSFQSLEPWKNLKRIWQVRRYNSSQCKLFFKILKVILWGFGIFFWLWFVVLLFFRETLISWCILTLRWLPQLSKQM